MHRPRDYKISMGRYKRAIKYYEEAKYYCCDLAQGRLNKLHEHRGITGNVPSAKPIHKAEQPFNNVDTPIKRYKLTGPYLPHVTISPTTSDPYLSIPVPLPQHDKRYTIHNAPSTLVLANIFRSATEAEKQPIYDMIYNVIQEYEEDLNAKEHIRELAVLAAIPDQKIFTAIINRLLTVENASQTLPRLTLHGLAVVLTFAPEEIDFSESQGILSSILVRLQERLRITRIESNNDELLPLLRAVSALFDSMLSRGMRHLNRADVYNPIKDQLTAIVSEVSVGVEESFLAQYAIQSIIHIGNDESRAMSIVRRGRLAISIIADVKSLITTVDITKFESIYDNIMSMSDVSIKMEWYQGLLFLDCLLAYDDLTGFEMYVIKSKLTSNEYFMQGVCLRLEQLVLSHRDSPVESGARDFLKDLKLNPAQS
ncbi:hypothetical protein BGZ76_004048, partial [Entomortierella beljakovae]